MINIPSKFKPLFVNLIFVFGLMIFVIVISNLFFFPLSLRLDESQSLWQVSRPFSKMLEFTARDVHTPLFNILLFFWISIFGSNILSARYMSLFFVVLCIPLTYLITRLITRKSSVAIFVSTMVSISPFLIWYGSELRMYSLFVFLTLCSHFCFLTIYLNVFDKYKKSRTLAEYNKVNKTNSNDNSKIFFGSSFGRFAWHALMWFSYFLFSILGIYTHYFFVIFIFCQFVFFVFNIRIYRLKGTLLMLFVVVLLSICVYPWISYVRVINAASSQAPALQKPTTIDLFNVYSNHFFGFQDDVNNSLILSLWPMLGILCLFLLQKKQKSKIENENKSNESNFANNPTNNPLNDIESVNRTQNVTQNIIGLEEESFSNNIDPAFGSITFHPKYIYLGIMTFLPTVTLFFVSVLYRPIFLSRYLIMCVVPMYILLGAILFSNRNWILTTIKTGIVLAMIAGLGIQIVNPNVVVKENYRELINYIIDNSSRDDIVAISTPFTIYPFKYYYNGSAKLVTVPEWDLITGIPPFTEEALVSQYQLISQKYKKMYLVLSYDQGYQKQIEQYSNSRFDLLSKKVFSPKLSLLIYKM